MKLIVFAHRLELGGTQVNAIELAANLRDRHGWDVVFHAAPGPALAQVRARGLRFAPAPDVRLHPSPKRIKALRALVREESPDLIHAWDWWQGLEAYLGAYLAMGLPVVISDMMMTLTNALPREVPTTFGFTVQKRQADARGWRDTSILRPPVDMVANAPDAVDCGAFRRKHGIEPDETLLVSVSRLARVMKAGPLFRAIRAIRALGHDLPLRLAIVGDGEARSDLAAAAHEANTELNRRAVLLTGPMTDPRPAYAAADIVLGMGGSALRAMAFARPVVVVGEQGFARIFDEHSAPSFMETGFFGVGPAAGTGNRAMSAAIRALAVDPTLRASLGRAGRAFVARHHGLDTVTDDLAGVCRRAVAARRHQPRSVLDVGRTTYHYLRERRFRVASRDRAGRA